jgi:hypothetical protein
MGGNSVEGSRERRKVGWNGHRSPQGVFNRMRRLLHCCSTPRTPQNQRHQMDPRMLPPDSDSDGERPEQQQQGQQQGQGQQGQHPPPQGRPRVQMERVDMRGERDRVVVRGDLAGPCRCLSAWGPWQAARCSW